MGLFPVGSFPGDGDFVSIFSVEGLLEEIGFFFCGGSLATSLAAVVVVQPASRERFRVTC